MALFSHKRILLVLAVIGGVLVWNYNRPSDFPLPRKTQAPPPNESSALPPPPAETSPPAIAAIPAPPAPPATASPAPPAPAPPAPASTPPATGRVISGSASEMPAAAEDITEDLSAVDSTIRNYQAVHGENPIGSNAEITTALFINNPKQIKLEVPAGSQINSEGQLCDRWATPYFFHQVSATEMEIRSAGPDREMWTGDDSQM